jgi:hypothetical protein
MAITRRTRRNASIGVERLDQLIFLSVIGTAPAAPYVPTGPAGSIVGYPSSPYNFGSFAAPAAMGIIGTAPAAPYVPTGPAGSIVGYPSSPYNF